MVIVGVGSSDTIVAIVAIVAIDDFDDFDDFDDIVAIDDIGVGVSGIVVAGVVGFSEAVAEDNACVGDVGDAGDDGDVGGVGDVGDVGIGDVEGKLPSRSITISVTSRQLRIN